MAPSESASSTKRRTASEDLLLGREDVPRQPEGRLHEEHVAGHHLDRLGGAGGLGAEVARVAHGEAAGERDADLGRAEDVAGGEELERQLPQAEGGAVVGGEHLAALAVAQAVAGQGGGGAGGDGALVAPQVVGVGVGDEAAGALAAGVEVEPGSADAELAGDQLDGGALHGEGVTGGAVAGPGDRDAAGGLRRDGTPGFRGRTLARPLLSGGSVPTISRFFGIVIQMYFKDHAPPHFHARVRGCEGRGPDRPGRSCSRVSCLPRALGLVMEWARLNRAALLEDWELRSQIAGPWIRIPPLE